MGNNIEPDHSLSNFFADLFIKTFDSDIQNSFIDFKYNDLPSKNKLYKTMELYNKDKTFLISEIVKTNPDIIIKRIREITIGEHMKIDSSSRCSYGTGTYYVYFTVYFEKKK